MSDSQTLRRTLALPGPRATHRIFLTGATGVIGQRLIPLLLEAGHQVTAVGRSPEKRDHLSRQGAQAVEADLFDPAAVRRAIGRSDVIINLATSVPAGLLALWPGAWSPMDRVRRRISANLANAAIEHTGIARFVQESFAGIYADAGADWIDESAEARPASFNRSTLEAEANAARAGCGGTVAVVLRFGLFYGENDAVTDQLLGSVRRGWWPLFGDPEGYSSWVSHLDAARAVLAALQVPAGLYNVVDDMPLKRRVLAASLAHRLGVRPPRFLPRWVTRIGGPVAGSLARSLRISNLRFRSAAAWAPRYPTALAGLSAVARTDA